MKAKERESAIIAAYQRGDRIEQMEQEFGVGRSTIYHILRRTGVQPNRSRHELRDAANDATIAALYELIMFQDRRIVELEDQLATSEEKKKMNGRRA